MRGRRSRRRAGRAAAALAGLLALHSLAAGVRAGDLLDLSGATILSPPDAPPLERRAAHVLREEIEERTGLRLPIAHRWPHTGGPVLAMGTSQELAALHESLAFLRERPSPGPEGYTLVARGGTSPVAVVAGADSRGVLYGAGRLLRKATWSPGRLTVPELHLSTAPWSRLRGVQLGNRNMSNTYDAWSAEHWDQYIRELALFGANAIELIPPFLADYPTDRSQRVLPPDEMMPLIVEAIDSYGMDVWLWYANLDATGDAHPGDEELADPEVVRKLLEQRARVFAGMKRLDALFVPGGDPGGLSPAGLFPWLGKLAPVLHQHHPNARTWVSDQFAQADDAGHETYLRHLNRRPAWLGGAVIGPAGRTSFAEMRERVEWPIPIRRYPDITHAMACQYPVPSYDRALALTLGREPPLPRPRAFKHIHNLYDEHALGAVVYSEGVNDDVNKFVWLDQEWDPETLVVETLRDYARVFIDPGLSEELAQGLLALEENLNGVLAENTQVETTLGQWQALEARVTSPALPRWRFQMGLFRAHYDALVKRRLVQDRHREYAAREALRRARDDGALPALDRARSLLGSPSLEAIGGGLEARCRELADRLRDSIGIQLSVERHGAVRQDRGAILDALDTPLNDAPWLLDRMKDVRELGDEAARLEAIEGLLNRANPGPGGLYDDYGSEASLRRVVAPIRDWTEDPRALHSVQRRFEFGGRWRHEGRPTPLAWLSLLSTLFDEPLSVRYGDLDPEASYRVRVVHGRSRPLPRLEADGHLIYDLGEAPDEPVLEHPVPVEATRDGEVILTWVPNLRSRKTTVAEVWLLKD